MRCSEFLVVLGLIYRHLISNVCPNEQPTHRICDYAIGYKYDIFDGIYNKKPDF